MRPDDKPTDDERREAEALAAALEPGEGARAGDTPVALPVALPGVLPVEGAPEALDVAGLLRHARASSSLSAEAEAVALARASLHLDARRARHRRRGRVWLATSLGVPAAAAAVLLVFFALPGLPTAPAGRGGDLTPPPPPPDLLAAQAQAARGGGQAIAALDLKMRAYRRVFHDGLRNRRGEAP